MRCTEQKISPKIGMLPKSIKSKRRSGKWLNLQQVLNRSPEGVRWGFKGGKCIETSQETSWICYSSVGLLMLQARLNTSETRPLLNVDCGSHYCLVLPSVYTSVALTKQSGIAERNPVRMLLLILSKFKLGAERKRLSPVRSTCPSFGDKEKRCRISHMEKINNFSSSLGNPAISPSRRILASSFWPHTHTCKAKELFFPSSLKCFELWLQGRPLWFLKTKQSSASLVCSRINATLQINTLAQQLGAMGSIMALSENNL